MLIFNKNRFFVCMVAYHLLLTLWIILERSIGFKKFHMKDQCVIYYGLTQMIDQDGVFLQEVLVIPLDRYVVVVYNNTKTSTKFSNLKHKQYRISLNSLTEIIV